MVLSSLGALDKKKVTHAGALMFAKDIVRHVPQAMITCALFQGKDKVKILDRKEFAGDVYSNYQNALVYLKSKLNTEFIIKGGGPRTEVLELPEEALRETILNAVAHRNYFLTGGIHIYIFADRVEFVSPGGLVKGMSKKDLGKKSLSRNQLLFGLMQRMDLVEEIGSGILRIKQAMKEYKLPAPKIIVEDHWFTVVYKRPELQKDAFQGRSEFESSEKGSEKSSDKIIEMIELNPKITAQEMADQIGISRRAIEKQLSNFKKEGVLKRMGGRKEGFWKIVP